MIALYKVDIVRF